MQNCWEFMHCGRQPGGVKVGELGVCPAAVDRKSEGINRGKNGGRCCWRISGSLCDGKVQGSAAAKVMQCIDCDFFKLVMKEEGAKFSYLAPQ